MPTLTYSLLMRATQMNEVRNALMVCGIPHLAMAGGGHPTNEVIASFGWDTMADVQITAIEDIKGYISSHNRNPATAYQIAGLMVRKLSALVWHMQHLQRMNAPYVPDDWTVARMSEVIAIMAMERNRAANGAAEGIKEPGKVDVGNKYPVWCSSFWNYLSSKIGASGVPLCYIVRKPTAAGWVAANDTQALIYGAVHTGPAYEDDNQMVYGILKGLALDTDALPWIEPFDNARDGRGAFLAMDQHYMGASAQDRRREWATAIIKDAHYQNEYSYSFDRFATALKDAYRILNSTGEQHDDSEMVREMLSKIRVQSNADIVAAKTFCRGNHANNFTAAVEYMAGEVTVAFPASRASHANRLKRKISETTAGRGGHRGSGRGGGRWGRGGRGGRHWGRGGRGAYKAGANDPEEPWTLYNGVDIADPTRTFSSEEMEALDRDGRAYMFRMRDRINGMNRQVAGATTDGDPNAATETGNEQPDTSGSSGTGGQGGDGRGGGRGAGRGGNNGGRFGRGIGH